MMRKRKLFKKIFLVFFILFIIAQFFQPEKNNGVADTPTDVTHYVTVPADVMQVLRTSCYDCHSNKTQYPWYSQITPGNFWLANHISDGKKVLNFSEFGSLSQRKMRSKLSSVAEQVQKREMPLQSYLFIHRNARLSDSQIKMVTNWADSAKQELSLKNK